MILAFPKIFSLGTDYIRDIFLEPVEFTEKVDGSQFSFGRINGEFVMRSKGKQIWEGTHEPMFLEAVSYVLTIQELIPNGVVIYGEYLKNPKHNILAYDRIPNNHIAVFGSTIDGHFDENWNKWCKLLDLESVPILDKSDILVQPGSAMGYIDELLKTESFLGGQNIEGIVVKNYHRPFLLGGQPIPLMMGKYVSEKFKEKHRVDWDKTKGKNRWEEYKESYRTEARWEKAVQHLRDNDELEWAPKDIGKLVKEVQRDIIEECRDEIKNVLWGLFGKDLTRKAIAGLPEWYKKSLVERG